MKTLISCCLGLAIGLGSAVSGHAAILNLIQTTELPGIEGDLDHLAIDTAGQRLFVAAEDNGTLRVIDLKTGKLMRTVKGLKTPSAVTDTHTQAARVVKEVPNVAIHVEAMALEESGSRLHVNVTDKNYL